MKVAAYLQHTAELLGIIDFNDPEMIQHFKRGSYYSFANWLRMESRGAVIGASAMDMRIEKIEVSGVPIRCGGEGTTFFLTFKRQADFEAFSRSVGGRVVWPRQRDKSHKLPKALRKQRAAAGQGGPYQNGHYPRGR